MGGFGFFLMLVAASGIDVGGAWNWIALIVGLLMMIASERAAR